MKKALKVGINLCTAATRMRNIAGGRQGGLRVALLKDLFSLRRLGLDGGLLRGFRFCNWVMARTFCGRGGRWGGWRGCVDGGGIRKGWMV